MAFNTALGANVLVLGDQVVFGTCMLGSALGVVKSASVKRTADRELLANCMGNLRAVLLKNPRFELTLETGFDLSITAPGLMEVITIPLAAVSARILDVEVKWSDNGERLLSIEATHWDALSAGSAYTYNGTTYTAL